MPMPSDRKLCEAVKEGLWGKSGSRAAESGQVCELAPLRFVREEPAKSHKRAAPN